MEAMKRFLGLLLCRLGIHRLGEDHPDDYSYSDQCERCGWRGYPTL